MVSKFVALCLLIGFEDEDDGSMSGKRTWPEWPEWPEIAGSKRFQANGSRKQ